MFLTVHTAGVCLVLVSGSGIETAQDQWGYLRQTARFLPGTLMLGFVIYALGQANAWRFLRSAITSGVMIESDGATQTPKDMGVSKLLAR
jgi:hypothetical protein